jgi:hypothetical protein
VNTDGLSDNRFETYVNTNSLLSDIKIKC